MDEKKRQEYEEELEEMRRYPLPDNDEDL